MTFPQRMLSIMGILCGVILLCFLILTGFKGFLVTLLVMSIIGVIGVGAFWIDQGDKR